MMQYTPQIRLYQDWLAREHDLAFDDYSDLWAWSTRDLDAFWRSIWDYFELESSTPFTKVVEGAMPDARWFVGSNINYARHVFSHADRGEAAGQPAIIAQDETGRTVEVGWHELRRRVASLALELRQVGVGRGDRVAAYLPNTPEAVVSLLACASLGAIWTVCSTDMGTPAVLDRFKQVAPKVLIAVDGLVYGGRAVSRSAAVEELRHGLPGLASVFIVRTPHAEHDIQDAVDFAEAQSRTGNAVARFEPEWLPFDHPLWILYSSGTTGLPKPIVHGHGGVIVATCAGALHMDIGPSYAANSLGERFHWYSTTGWVMWNVQVGGLLTGSTICLFDGSPSGPRGQPDWTPLWTFAARHRVTWFGAGAAFYNSCRKADLDLSRIDELAAVRALGSTGSPLAEATQRWGDRQFDRAGGADVWWCNISGGTDIAAAFLSGNRELPPAPGRLQCRHLGAAIAAWDEEGRSVIGQVGELVCTEPFPSMPLFFWGDEDGSRYRASYFEPWPGIWRHGDWLRIDTDGSCDISGRSDATINRQGLRMGTAELYAAVEGLAQVADSLVIDLEDGSGDSKLVMFVAPHAGGPLDSELEAAIGAAIRSALSPRFIPDVYIRAPGVLRTLSGKKQELPVKRLFQGWPLEKVMNVDGVENPELIPWYLERARSWLTQ